MVTAPLFLILALFAFVSVRYGKSSPGGMFLGVALGLSLASTALGPPILDGITFVMTSAVDSLSSVAG